MSGMSVDSRRWRDAAENGCMPRLWRRRVLYLMYPLESVLRGTGGGVVAVVERRESDMGRRDARMVDDRPRLSKVVLGMESVLESSDSALALL